MNTSRVIAARLVAQEDLNEAAVLRRAESRLLDLFRRLCAVGISSEDRDGEGLNDLLLSLPRPVRARLRRRVRALIDARKRSCVPMPEHVREAEKVALMAAAARPEPRGVVAGHRADEMIAKVHARAPWMALASTIVMREMRARTAKGPAPFRCPPIIIEGGPGIGKSAWARSLGEAFGVPVITCDVGATNGAVFTLSGSERNWGKSSPGVVVAGMIAQRVPNPLVVVDEIDRAASCQSEQSRNLPGLMGVLMSMIEPETARAWTCPYYQLPFDLTGISWVMTTNDASRLPQALLDRCRLVRVQDPTREEMVDAAWRMACARLGPCEHAAAVASRVDEMLVRGQRVTLRVVQRLIDRAEAIWGAERPQ